MRLNRRVKLKGQVRKRQDRGREGKDGTKQKGYVRKGDDRGKEEGRERREGRKGSGRVVLGRGKVEGKRR